MKLEVLVWHCWVGSACVGVAALGVIAQSVPPIQFVTSEMESLKLDKLRLESQVISLRKQLAESELSCANAGFRQELNSYTVDTLKAHGNPEGITLDPNTMSWKVEEKKKPMPPPTPTPTPTPRP